jgi:acyl-CoA oxidase
MSDTQVAALLLKKYKDRFSAAPLTATYRYLRQWASDSLPPNPLVAHDTDTRHLRDPAFLVRALRSLPPLRHTHLKTPGS